MSKLTRYTQQLFGSTASTNQIAEFGSLAAGSPARYSGSTITPAIVQTLGNFLSGWFTAVEGLYSPAIEDMNALFYLAFYQLCYLMQEGIPEWDSGTTYYTGSMVQSSGVIYISLVDSNLNHAVTSGSFWKGQLTQPGYITTASTASVTVTSGQTLFWPDMTVSVGNTLTINSGANLESLTKVIVNGTLIVNGYSRVI